MSNINRKFNTRITPAKFMKEFNAWILLLPVVIIMYLMIWRPTVFGFIWSFFKTKGFRPETFCGLDNYIEVVTATNFPTIMLNTLKYVFWSLVIGYIPPIIIAVILNEMVYFKNAIKVTIYLPNVMPGIVVLLLWYYIYYPDSTGMLNMILSYFNIEPQMWLGDARLTIPLIVLTMTWSGLPGTMLLYFSALQGISSELYEAALIDGAGILKRVRYVTLPQIGGTLLICFVNQIIGIFQVMQEPMSMTGGGPNDASTSMGYYLYTEGFINVRAGNAMAIGSIMFFILLIMTCFYFRLNKKIEENY